MLGGFNTNIRHRTVLFHVQSEDSGLAHPHVITHLYYGGTILQSVKSSYSERLDEEDLPSVVKGLMESQHKAVLKRLVAGEFDDLIRERLGEGVFDDDPGDTRASTRPNLDAADAPPGAPGVTMPVEPVTAPTASARSFGSGIVSERPLDEVILDYLVENARKRRRKK